MNYNLLSQVPVTPDQVHRALTTQDYTTIGVLIVGFIIIVLGGWKLSSWFGKEIVLPSRDKLFVLADQFKDKMFEHLNSVGSTMKDISSSLQQLMVIPERLDRLEEKVDTIGNRVDKIDEHLTLQDNKFPQKHNS